MASAPTTTRLETFGELLEQLGDISPHRVRLHPPPGKATEKDVIKIHDRTNRLYELVDGVLVEKVMGYPEPSVTCTLIRLLGNFLDKHDLGNLAGADGTIRLMPKLVRIPDSSFVRWENLSNREITLEPIPDLVPDLAVEVLSESNTPKEMERKLREYFLVGVKLVWFVDPESRTVQVFTAPDQSVVLTEADTLDGGDVLPGLSLPLRRVFARLPPMAKRIRSRQGKPSGADKRNTKRKGNKS
jgi:Uma2 family endonuclease